MSLEGPVVWHAHRLAQYIDEDLVGDGHGVCEEEEAQSDVEEGQRGDDGLCGYERHVVVWLVGQSIRRYAGRENSCCFGSDGARPATKADRLE